MAEETPQNQSTEIPNNEIIVIGENTPKAIEAKCIKNDTIKLLCDLKSNISLSKEQMAYSRIEELLNAQEYLARTAKAENENEILLIVRSPDGKYYLTKVPRSFGESQRLSINVNGENINLEAVPLTNGYNTEYKINDGNGDWRQIAILFTTINPEWKKIDKKIQEIENEIKFINSKIKELNSENLKSKNSLSKTKKTKKDKILLAIINKNNNELKKLSGRLKTLEGGLPNLQEELAKHKKLVNFPYTPYNKQYDKDEFHSHGFAYLNHGTKKAWEHLGEEKSIVGGEKKLKINESFSNDIATTLNIVERMDFAIYFQDKDRTILKPQDTVNAIMDSQIKKTLTTIAINQKGAYNWQRSNVGALGIGQFMPGTYDKITSRYKNVFPDNLNFENGAKNHDISFRMQAIHFHEETRQFPKWIRDNWERIVEDEEAKLGLYALIAAGYNGDIKRVVKEAELGREANVDYLIERLNNEFNEKISKIESNNRDKRKKKMPIELIDILKEIIKEKKLDDFSKYGVDFGILLKEVNKTELSSKDKKKLKRDNDINNDIAKIAELIRKTYNDTEIKESFFQEEVKKLHPENLLSKLGKNKETQTYVMKFIYTWDYLKSTYRDFGI